MIARKNDNHDETFPVQVLSIEMAGMKKERDELRGYFDAQVPVLKKLQADVDLHFSKWVDTAGQLAPAEATAAARGGDAAELQLRVAALEENLSATKARSAALDTVARALSDALQIAEGQEADRVDRAARADAATAAAVAAAAGRIEVLKSKNAELQSGIRGLEAEKEALSGRHECALASARRLREENAALVDRVAERERDVAAAAAAAALSDNARS